MTRDELIAALEAASGPDADLGREILLACGWRKTCVGHFYGPLYQWSGPNGGYFKDDDFARHDPTRSLDAALSLVPDGWLYSLGNDGREYGQGWARVFPREGQHKGTGNQYAATELLALCLAAIRARGTGEG